MLRLIAGIVFVGAVTAAMPAAAATDWRQEQWVVEDFTGTIGGGPPVGPAVEAGGIGLACGDKAGNIYLLGGNEISIITPEGVKYRLAGAGRGYRDGPANRALFNQGGSYNVARSIQCDAHGNIYTAENGNHRVRRIFKNADGKWMVDTVAGGGKRKLKPGETAAPLEVDLDGNIAVATAPDGTLTIGSQWLGVFRVGPDRKTIRHLGRWPSGHPCLVMADGDLKGNSYFIYRGRASITSGVWRVSKEGKIERIAGLPPSARKKYKHKPHQIGDGPPLSIFIDTPTSIAASPDGSVVYSCGGDEYDIRRIPTDLKTTTATLVKNGRWYIMPVHPNRNRGKPEYNPKLTGKSKVEGGPLSDLMNCGILGRDYEGNLYGYLYSWVGATQWVAGKGQLRTTMYRIRRVKKGDRP